MSRSIEAANNNWSLFVKAYDRVNPFTGQDFGVCPAMLAYYEEVNDDPEFPPYDAPALRCTALDGMLA
jgi:hypothetical protein